MTMNVADQDRLELEKLVDEATQLRSREAFSALVEVAYVLGWRTGFAEAGETFGATASSMAGKLAISPAATSARTPAA
jgi:hypothetical protein